MEVVDYQIIICKWSCYELDWSATSEFWARYTDERVQEYIESGSGIQKGQVYNSFKLKCGDLKASALIGIAVHGGQFVVEVVLLLRNLQTLRE